MQQDISNRLAVGLVSHNQPNHSLPSDLGLVVRHPYAETVVTPA